MQRFATNGEFQFPRDGVMLTEYSGERIGDTLKITVLFNASNCRNLTLNGEPMTRFNYCCYKCDFVMQNGKNTLTVKDVDSGEEWSIVAVFLRNGYKKYRFSLDDNIWFLQNLNENKDTYTSLFDDPYLALLKKIHDMYGSKFHINIYYETPRHGGFNLSQMTDKYKEEWKANGDWMRLAFHANSDLPNRPYGFATYEKAYFEMDRVHKEILRFAGEEAFAKTVTSIHFGDCTKEAAKAFRDLGVKAFVGCYNWNSSNNADIRMYLDAEQCSIVNKFGYYYDKEMDIYHFAYNGGIQGGDPKGFYEMFDRDAIECPVYRFKEFCLHEQYFYPEFKRHLPDYYERMEVAARWCRDNGYDPVFAEEIFEFNSH